MASNNDFETSTELFESDGVLNKDGPTMGAYHYLTFHNDGQMSTIYKAQSTKPITTTPDATSTTKIVALKVTHPSTMLQPHNSYREARLLNATAHPSIVPLFDSFTHPSNSAFPLSSFVLVFPFLRQDLENLLRTSALTPSQSRQIYTALFSALSYLQSEEIGMIHRDIKPSNILLATMSGPVYLADFGIAWSPSDPDSEPADKKITDVGTTCYRPPELLFGNRIYDCSLDIWAAGCVVAEMLRGPVGHWPVFDAGPLGSELGLIKSMFETLGTPDEKIWPVSEFLTLV